MWNKIKSIFSFSKDTKNINNIISDNTIFDIIVSLNKNFEINIQLFLDDKIKYKNISQTEYALVYSEFLNIIMNGKIKNQILDIIKNQIRNDNNKQLIDNILNFLSLMDKTSDTNQHNIPMIKPTQVFAKYKNG